MCCCPPPCFCGCVSPRALCAPSGTRGAPRRSSGSGRGGRSARGDGAVAMSTRPRMESETGKPRRGRSRRAEARSSSARFASSRTTEGSRTTPRRRSPGDLVARARPLQPGVRRAGAVRPPGGERTPQDEQAPPVQTKGLPPLQETEPGTREGDEEGGEGAGEERRRRRRGADVVGRSPRGDHPVAARISRLND